LLNVARIIRSRSFDCLSAASRSPNTYDVAVVDAKGVETEKLSNVRVSYKHISDPECNVDVWIGSCERLKPQGDGCGVIFHRCEKVWKKTVPSGAAASEQN
jgi:hypothetical protein